MKSILPISLRLLRVSLPGHAIIALIALLALGGASTQAEPFQLIWFSYAKAPNESGNNTDGPQTVADDGVSLAITYSSSDMNAIKTYLNFAQLEGIRVIMHMRTSHVGTADAALIQGYVNDLEHYATNVRGAPDLIAGWYMYDEPDTISGFTPTVAAAAYNAVKAVTSKPVYANIDADEPNTQNSYKDSFDVMTTHDYPFARNSAEFVGLEDTWGGIVNGWKSWMQASAANADANGKDWIPVLQGYGDVGIDLRLPTAAEQRFMTYYVIHHGADGIAYWSKARSLQSPAQPGAPYEGDGPAWAQDVFQPLADEVNPMAAALDEPEIANAVTTDNNDVLARVIHDPVAGDYFLLTINTGDAIESATFDLTGLPVDISGLTPMSVGSTPTLVGDQFTESFSPYEVKNYRIDLPIVLLPGDVNGDGFVGIDDLNIILSNWNMNVPPVNPLADPSGDGFVGIDDLNAVLGNWNAGTPPSEIAHIPEPGSLAMLGVTTLCALRRQRD